jgi:hypothetical protein
MFHKFGCYYNPKFACYYTCFIPRCVVTFPHPFEFCPKTFELIPNTQQQLVT